MRCEAGCGSPRSWETETRTPCAVPAGHHYPSRDRVSAAGAAGRARDWTQLRPPRSLQRTGQEALGLPEPGGPAPRGAGRGAGARPFQARLRRVACGPLLEFPPRPPGCVVCRH